MVSADNDSSDTDEFEDAPEIMELDDSSMFGTDSAAHRFTPLCKFVCISLDSFACPVNQTSMKILKFCQSRSNLDIQNEDPKYLFPRGNQPLLYHQIGNINFSIFITDQYNLMFCVDKIKYEHLAILSNLKSCQFAPKIVIFNLCICCQFEDSQIILPKIIPMSHCNI